MAHPPRSRSELERALVAEVERLRSLSPVQRVSFAQSSWGRPLVERAEQAEERLRRLEPFVQHRDSCKVNEYENAEAGARVKPCTCGLRAARGEEP